MSKKIVTCAPLPPPCGGIANWYKILLSECKKNGYEVLNINTSPRKSIDSRTIFYRVFVQGFRMIAQRRELNGLIRGNKDVSVAHIATSGSLALVRDILFLKLLRRKKVRSVYHIHYGRIPETFEAKTIEYRLLKKALSLTTNVIAIDPKTFSVLSKDLGKEKVHYIPNPVNEISVIDNEETKNVLFLGNVLKSKGVEELLQAWEKISEKYPDWTLIIAGFCEDEYKEYLIENYSQKNVIMTGLLDHDKAIEMLKKSAFLVLPSYTEGFPNVVIEAMMCSKAVVATDVGAISDILGNDCGVVITPKNTNELYASMKTLIDNNSLREKMGQQGRKKALEQYEAGKVFEQYVKLWEGEK